MITALKVIDTGFFKLDGGAMFGVVPKTMWSKTYPPDENNMCTWAMRCLLIETDDNRRILIDTGLGNKQDEKFRSHFSPHGEATLLNSLAVNGCTPDDITDVIITHFHFDHVGGAVIRDEYGELVPTFQKATYWSNKAHYDWAFSPNPREKASFLKENFVPLRDHNVLQYIDQTEGVALFQDIHLGFCYGHTEALMTPYLTFQGKTLIYCADLLASPHHIGLPYVMAYDIRPLDTMKEKERVLRRAAEEEHILFFEHDKAVECATVKINDKGNVVLKETFPLSNAFL